jgi:hypothetical protein
MSHGSRYDARLMLISLLGRFVRLVRGFFLEQEDTRERQITAILFMAGVGQRSLTTAMEQIRVVEREAFYEQSRRDSYRRR